MAKLRVVAGAQLDAANGDLRSQVHFCAETGQIWLHEHRMLLVHAEAQALLRGFGPDVNLVGLRKARNNAAIGGIKVTTEHAWFAARPSGTEDKYKIYAESLKSGEHLVEVQAAAKALVDQALDENTWDTDHYYDRIGFLHKTGPTNTNVCDVQITIIR